MSAENITPRPVETARRGGPAIRASFVAFATMGVVTATWAARIPQVKSQLGLTSSALGLVLLAMAAGSVVALPAAGWVVVRLGSRRAFRAVSLLSAAGLIVVAFGARGQTAAVVAGLFAMGVANGVWDVAINVQGARVEQQVERPLMPRFHAWYGIGTVIGAAAGVAMVAVRASVTLDLLIVAGVVPSAVWFATRSFLPDHDHLEPHEQGAARAHNGWRERRTVLIGLIVLAFALTEGSGNDWISVSMIQGRHAAPAVATLAYGVFLALLTAGRWIGPQLLERFGRARALRVLALVAIAGLVVFVLAPWTPLAFLGAALWGVGASLGFPVGMSAGADEPALAAPRVGVIASIGYCAFLGGPPLIGLIASSFGLPHALAVVVVPLVPAAGIATVAAPLRSACDDAAASAAPALSTPAP
ncbi:MAG TPA: MFS transporter [Solirubrobacteraceae bacterium]|nr:MFS transporter [Solirubrobacteraceae bacterium]